MKKIKVLICILTIFILVSCGKDDKKEIEKVLKDFSINTYDIFLSMESPDYSLIHEEGENLKKMIEERNTIAIRHFKKLEKEDHYEKTDYSEYEKKFKFEDIYINGDYALGKYQYDITTKDGSGYAPRCSVILKKDNRKWKVVQILTDHDPWDELFLSEEDDKRFHENQHLPTEKLTLKEELKELKNFNYDISNDKIEELNREYKQ